MYCTGMNLSNDTGDMGRTKVHQIHITCSDSESVVLEEPSSHSTSRPAKTPIFWNFHLSTNEATGQKKNIWHSLEDYLYLCNRYENTWRWTSTWENTENTQTIYTRKAFIPNFHAILKTLTTSPLQHHTVLSAAWSIMNARKRLEKHLPNQKPLIYRSCKQWKNNAMPTRKPSGKWNHQVSSNVNSPMLECWYGSLGLRSRIGLWRRWLLGE